MKIYQFRGLAFRLDQVYQVNIVRKPDPDREDRGKTRYHFTIDLAVPHVGNRRWTFYFKTSRSGNIYRNKLIAAWTALEPDHA